MVMINSKGKINMTDVTFKNCSSAGNGILQTEVSSGVTFGGTLTFTDCTGNELAQKDACRFVISEDAKFTAPMKLKLNTEAYGKLALIFNNSDDAATYSRYFIIANDGYGLYQSKNNGTYEFSTTEAYTLTVNEYGASTLILPYASMIPHGVTAYTLAYTSGADHVTATEVNGTLAANTPVLINAAAGPYKFSNTASVTAATTGSGTHKSGALTGVYAETTPGTGHHILSVKNSKLGFYKTTANSKVAPYHAYLTATTSAPAFLDFVYGSTSAIETPRTELNAHGVYYNLNGQRVDHPTKGLYIVNGKKVIMK